MVIRSANDSVRKVIRRRKKPYAIYIPRYRSEFKSDISGAAFSICNVYRNYSTSSGYLKIFNYKGN